MSLAYASKDQMKVWKSALKPEKDGHDVATTKVQFIINAVDPKDKTKGYTAHLIATDGYQAMKRQIEVEADAGGEAPLKIGIPREAVEQAEKAMKKGDRAYFDDGKITVREITEEEATGFEDSRIKAIIPYTQQMDLLPDYEVAVEKAVNSEQPGRVVTIDAGLLRKIADQMKSGDARVTVDLHLREGLDGFVLRSFEGIEGEEITAVIMPLKV